LRSSLLAPVVLATWLLGCSGTSGSSDGGPPAPCVTGPGTTTLHSSGYITGLAAGGGTVVAASDEGLVSFPLAGGPRTVLATPAQLYGAFVIGQTVYFSAARNDGPPDPQGKQPTTSALFSIPITGGTPVEVLANAPDLVNGMAVTDATTLYFNSQDGAVSMYTPPATSVVKLPIGDPKLAMDAVAAHGDWVYVAAQDLGSTALKNGVIARIPRAGGSVERIVTGIGHPWRLAAGDAGLYWIEDPPTGTFGPGGVGHAALDGSGATLVTDGTTMRTIALDGGQLFLASDAVGVMPAAGGAETIIAAGPFGSPDFLGVDGGNLLWVDPSQQDHSSGPTLPMKVLTACIAGGP
jgi:hypothetical protein